MYQNFQEILDAAKRGPKRTIVIAAAAESHILQLVGQIQKHNLCDVILVDHQARIRELANSLGIDLQGVSVIHEEDPSRAALAAVAHVSSGKADILVKGKINTSDFLRAVLNKDVGLRTGRRLSTLACYDVPGEKKLFFITDGGMNIAPDRKAKADILRNAVDVLHSFGIPKPNVALLSANEKVNPDMQSTVDAAALCEMAEKGELPDAVYEGPIAFDVAMRPSAAKAKGLHSGISGNVDLFLVPNIETGNCLGKAIGYFGSGKAAVLLVGASRPVVMTSRSASVESKLNAIAFALLACGKTSEREECV